MHFPVGGGTLPGFILVVDDHPANLKLTRVVLEAEGYCVQTAPSAEAVLQLLVNSRPELILMDLQLPGMDGLALTRRLKADPVTSSIPVVALTAYAMLGDEETARAAGCDEYVTKPVDTRRLVQVVRSLL